MKVWGCSECNVTHPDVFKFCPYCGKPRDSIIIEFIGPQAGKDAVKKLNDIRNMINDHRYTMRKKLLYLETIVNKKE